MSDGNEDPKTGVALSDGPVHNPDVVLIRKAREDRKYRKRWLLHTLSRKNLMALTRHLRTPYHDTKPTI